MKLFLSFSLSISNPGKMNVAVTVLQDMQLWFTFTEDFVLAFSPFFVAVMRCKFMLYVSTFVKLNNH